MTIALRAENVTKIYGSGADAVTAVDNVSFDVQEGEFVAWWGQAAQARRRCWPCWPGCSRPARARS